MSIDTSRHRLGLLAVAALSLFGALFARLWVLQVVEGDTLALQAEGNAQQEVIVPAPRGRILDRNGVVLVDNREAIVLGLDRQVVDELEDDERAALLTDLVEALNVPPEALPPIVEPEDVQLDEDGVARTDEAEAEAEGEGTTETTQTTVAPTTVPEVGAPEAEPAAGEPQGADPTEPRTTYTVDDLERRLDDPRYSSLAPVPVADDITEDQLIFFSEQADRFPGVVVERATVRWYPYGQLAAHVLGYVGSLSDAQWAELEDDNDPRKPYVQTDEIGKAGVEAQYEEYLRGVPGKRVYEVDRRGRPVREIESLRQEPEQGDDLYLALDIRVQYLAEAALQTQLERQFQGQDGREAGGLVVMDHDTGQVRAMASYPTYDPSDLVGGISCPTWRDLQGVAPEGPCDERLTEELRALRRAGEAPVPKLLNRAIQGDYNPASTFKLASAYAALATGIRTPETTIADPGFVRFCEGDTEGCVKTNAGSTPYGAVNLRRSLTVSSDVYYYLVGSELWASREERGETIFQDKVAELGYGSPTGIDLPGELGGQIPTPEKEMEVAMALFEADPEAYDNDIEVAKDAGRWRTGFSADIAIGQKLTSTPLQNANAYAALANGGTLHTPSVLDKITAAGEPDEVRRAHEPDPIRSIDWGAARDEMIFAFRGVVDPTGQNDAGTAVRTFQGFPFGSMPLAGKTGTAQTGDDPRTGIERPDNSLFVAFTTGGPSAWTASAMLEYSGAGGFAAAPAVRMVLEPIADGSLFAFQVPAGGVIDQADAAQRADGIAVGAAD